MKIDIRTPAAKRNAESSGFRKDGVRGRGNHHVNAYTGNPITWIDTWNQAIDVGPLTIYAHGILRGTLRYLFLNSGTNKLFVHIEVGAVAFGFTRR